MNEPTPENRSADAINKEDLETLFDFPCDFPVKAIGRAEGSDDHRFRDLVVDSIRQHAPELDETAVTTRPGSKGNYLAVTVTIRATSRRQLDAIYQDLSAHPDVIMAL